MMPTPCMGFDREMYYTVITYYGVFGPRYILAIKIVITKNRCPGIHLQGNDTPCLVVIY